MHAMSLVEYFTRLLDFGWCWSLISSIGFGG
jgi:hypothetical protein